MSRVLSIACYQWILQAYGLHSGCSFQTLNSCPEHAANHKMVKTVWTGSYGSVFSARKRQSGELLWRVPARLVGERNMRHLKQRIGPWERRENLPELPQDT